MTEAATEKSQALLAGCAIVLVGPKSPENIGSAARVAANMGIGSLILVCPELPDRDRMMALATRKAARLIEGIVRYDELAAALAPFGWVLGTSARQGGRRPTTKSPRQLMGEIVPLLAHNRLALLFGPEDRGLSNEELRFCNQITTIPTADFSSLNLAQAVAILCHELHSSVLEACLGNMPAPTPKQADKGELEAMFDQIKETLMAIGFFKEEESGHSMQPIRRFLGRLGLRAKEVRIIRGVCRQLLWDRKRIEPDGKW